MPETKIAESAEQAKKALKKVAKVPVLQEFKDFIARGNVIDLAVGVVIGSAFGKIVTSLVDDILMPILGVILNGVDFSGLSINVGEAQIQYGMFIQNIVDFLIVAACIFVIVKILNKFLRQEQVKKDEAPKEPSVEEKQLALLEEIRDQLAKK